MLKALYVGNFFLFCRYEVVGYQLLGAVKNTARRVVVEARAQRYFAKIPIAIIRGYLCFV